MKIILTTGDPNGIGIEILVKALAKAGESDFFRNVEFTVAANPKVLEDYIDFSGSSGFLQGEYLSAGKTDCRLLPCEKHCKIHFGNESAEAGAAAADSIENALQETISGNFDALVTMPISKAAVYKAGWQFPGHTEMLAERCRVKNPMMILCTRKLRVSLATIHIPVKNVSEMITSESIIERISAFNNSLKFDYGIMQPSTAVLGLNPHAGEGGAIGSEELKIIAPAVSECSDKGIKVNGPHPADGFFAHGAYKNYDGILAMYHDQGLIPLKLLAFGAGVNFTAGLPVVRTSPDHGTAFTIAGKNLADETSAFEAVRLAVEIYNNRKKHLGK